VLWNILSAVALVDFIDHGATAKRSFIEGKKVVTSDSGLGIIFTSEKLDESIKSHKQTGSFARHRKLSLPLVVLARTT
jgi:hypothetical protein